MWREGEGVKSCTWCMYIVLISRVCSKWSWWVPSRVTCHKCLLGVCCVSRKGKRKRNECRQNRFVFFTGLRRTGADGYVHRQRRHSRLRNLLSCFCSMCPMCRVQTADVSKRNDVPSYVRPAQPTHLAVRVFAAAAGGVHRIRWRGVHPPTSDPRVQPHLLTCQSLHDDDETQERRHKNESSVSKSLSFTLLH